MNKINPLYIVAIFLVILLISFVKVSELSNKLKTAQSDFQTFKESALKYNTLNSMSSTKDINTFIKKVSSDKLYSKANLKIDNKNKSVEFNFIGKNYKTYQKFINEILNKNFKILSLEINESNTKIELSKT